MKFDWRQFGGMFPRLRGHLLPNDGATLAINTSLQREGVGSIMAPSFAATPAKVGVKKAIYRFGEALDSDSQYWFHWLNDTDATRGPVPDDTSERTYYTEAGQVPRVTDNSIALAGPQYPFASYALGLPAPTACSANVTGTPTDPDAVALRTVVVYTYVSGWGEEGPPSPASNSVDWRPGQTVAVTLMAGAPVGNYNVTHKRLYIALYDEDGVGVFRFWTQVAVGTAGHSSTLDQTAIAASEALASPTLLAPPADLFGIAAHPGRFLFGFSGKLFCRSEVNRPHGWPLAYQDPLPNAIVGGKIVGAVVIVCTTAKTYRAAGSDPLNFAIDEVELAQPCVSKRSIVTGDGGVLYASSDGVVLVAATGAAELITRDILTAKQWQAYNPKSMLGVFHDGHYFVFYDTGSSQGGLVFDFVRKQFWRTSVYATAAYSEPKRNALFLMVGNDIVKWDSSATPLAMLWQSKEVITDWPTTFCGARVVADAYPVTFGLYGDLTLRHTQVVSGPEPFPMPGEYKARKWQIELSGALSGEVSQAAIAHDIHEFSGEDE